MHRHVSEIKKFLCRDCTKAHQSLAETLNAFQIIRERRPSIRNVTYIVITRNSEISDTCGISNRSCIDTY